MAYYAWYYYAGKDTYYWAEAHTMSATEFAQKVSDMIDKRITAADISATKQRSSIESIKKRAKVIVPIS